MDEKRSAIRDMPNIQIPSRLRRTRILVIALALISVVYFSFHNGSGLLSGCYHGLSDTKLATAGAATTKPGYLVPLEAHIISKCPDTRDAMRQLVLPVMQKIHDKVNFTLSYIGSPAPDDGINCKHGPSECMGNIIELCARELYPDPKTNLGFVMCLTKEYQSIPDRTLVEDCALEHAIDIQKLNECATRDDGAHGLGLLRASVQRTSDANVTLSCTVRLDNEIYCIRDGGEWVDCPHGAGVNDLVIAIEKLYHRHS